MSARKVKVHGLERLNKKILSPREIYAVGVGTEKTPERVVLHPEGSAAGEYAVAFQTRGQILSQVFDFRVSVAKQ